MAEQGENEKKSPSNLVLAAKIGAGLALALLVMVVYGGLRDEPPSHGSAVQAADPEATLAAVSVLDTESPLSLFEQVVSQGGWLAGRATLDPVRAYKSPGEGAEEVASFSIANEIGDPVTLLVRDEQVDSSGVTWYEVQLPIRPNGFTGWLPASQIQPEPVWHRLVVDLSDFRLDLFEGDALVKTYPIGLGKADTPTPTGDFYITSKMQPPDPNTVYGALAMGVSAFSEQLTDWPGGGQVGIHGTNDPENSIGRNVSAGCIRLRNEDILELNKFVPLGAPVRIQS